MTKRPDAAPPKERVKCGCGVYHTDEMACPGHGEEHFPKVVLDDSAIRLAAICYADGPDLSAEGVTRNIVEAYLRCVAPPKTKPGVRVDTEGNRWYGIADHIHDDLHPEDALPRTKDFHPDDRSTDPEDAPGGPWEVLKVTKREMSRNPIIMYGWKVWDLKYPASTFFGPRKLCVVARNALNRFERREKCLRPN